MGLHYGLNALVTLQQVELEQRTSTPLSRLALSTQRGWFAGAVGDVSPTLSRYSMSGVTTRGAYLELTPGDFLFTAVGGRSRTMSRPTDDNPLLKPTYEQYLWGGRLGWGQEGRTFGRVGALYVRDRAGSLDLDAITVADPTAPIDPAANLSVTGQGGWLGLGGRLRLDGEVTFSGITRDVDAPLADDAAGFPFGTLIGARVGSSSDWAGQAGARLNLPDGSVQVSYERAAPGFESLGLSQQRADQEVIRIRPSWRFAAGKVQVGLDVQQRRNNLNDALGATLRRRQGNATLQWRPRPTLSLAASYLQLDNESIPSANLADAAQYDTRQRSQTVTFSPTLVVVRGETAHTLNVTTLYQRLSQGGSAFDQGLIPAAGFTNATGTAAYSVALPSGLSLNANASALRSNTPGTNLTALALQLGAGTTLWERLALNASVGASRNSAEADMTPVQVGTQLNTTVTSTLRVRAGSTLALNLRGLTSSATGSPSFTEGQATLRFEQRF